MKIKHHKYKKRESKPEYEDLHLEYVDIKEILDHLNIPFSESGKNVSHGWIGVQCPFPHCDDISTHCGLCLTTPIVSCYACGKKGNYLTYLAAEVRSWAKAKELIKQFIPRELKQYEENEKNENTVIRVDLPAEAVKKMPEEHRQFLKGRGFNPEILHDLYDFHYCDNNSDWANRIIVPIYQRNRLITFTSISIEDDPGLRYKHFKKEESIIHCKNYLLGIEHVMGNVIIVVEGFFDMTRIGPGCVCTFGTNITAEQKLMLIKFSKVILVFDGDGPGRRAAKKLGYELAPFTEVEIIHLPDEMDPDKLPDEDIEELQQMVKIKW